MSVLKRGNSKFWYIQFQLRGKTYIRSSRTTDKKVAEQMEREWKRQIHGQEYLGVKERIKTSRILEDYLNSKKSTPNHSNLISHKKTLVRLFKLDGYLDEITSQDLERLKRDRLKEGSSPATVKHTLSLVRGMWKFGRKMGYLVNDLEFPEVKGSRHRLRYLSVDEEKLLLKELNPRREGRGLTPYTKRTDDLKQLMVDSYDLVVLLLDTGARYGEIANIEWSSIDLNANAIHLWRPKVQNESILYMTERVRRILEDRYRNPHGRYVFTNKLGGPRGYANQSIRNAMKRAGLMGCTIHTLRHTHATRLIQNGMSIYEVKEILGHSDIKTTMRYAHLEQKVVSSRARDLIEKMNQDSQKPNLRIVGGRNSYNDGQSKSK
jgi:integrase